MPLKRMTLQVAHMPYARSKCMRRAQRILENSCWLIWQAVSVPRTARAITRIASKKVQR